MAPNPGPFLSIRTRWSTLLLAPMLAGALSAVPIAAGEPTGARPAEVPRLAPGTPPDLTYEALGLDPTSRLPVTIRMYDGAGLPPRVRSDAMHRAAEILDTAQMRATWLDCTTSAATAPPRCADPLDEGELVLRIIREKGPPQPEQRRLLGYSLIDGATGTGVFASVFINRVEWLSDHSRTDHVLLLARAIAHEVGHLLLGTADHGPAGLMRALWTSKELIANRPDDWTFSVAERMRVLFARHSRSPRPARS
jgi:hypothetical protein